MASPQQICEHLSLSIRAFGPLKLMKIMIAGMEELVVLNSFDFSTG